MTWKIRPANRGDGPEVYRLLEELAISVTGVVIPEKSTFLGQFERILESSSFRALVAEKRGKLSGVVTLWLREDLLHGGKVALIEELVVAKEARSRGVGTALIERALDMCRREGCIEVEVSTEPENQIARHFYAKLGFEEVGLLLERGLD